MLTFSFNDADETKILRLKSCKMHHLVEQLVFSSSSPVIEVLIIKNNMKCIQLLSLAYSLTRDIDDDVTGWPRMIKIIIKRRYESCASGLLLLYIP